MSRPALKLTGPSYMLTKVRMSASLRHAVSKSRDRQLATGSRLREKARRSTRRTTGLFGIGACGSVAPCTEDLATVVPLQLVAAPRATRQLEHLSPKTPLTRPLTLARCHSRRQHVHVHVYMYTRLLHVHTCGRVREVLEQRRKRSGVGQAARGTEAIFQGAALRCRLVHHCHDVSASLCIRD